MEDLANTPPEKPKGPAIEALDRIIKLKFPKLDSPEETRGFFNAQGFGSTFADIINTHGELSVGHMQLSGSYGNQRFYARHFPEVERDGQIVPGKIHIILVPTGEWLSTTALTIQEKSGTAFAQNYSRETIQLPWNYDKPLNDADTFLEVQHTAALMHVSLEYSQTESEVLQETGTA